LHSKSAPSREAAGDAGTCRFCETPLTQTFVDLGAMPPANNYLQAPELVQPEPFYPLHAYVCTDCQLVQLEEIQTPEQLFSQYAYFSSFSKSWLDHMKRYAHGMIDRFELNKSSMILEVASNDGYLLQFFKKKRIPVLGIEPAVNIARAAKVRGIPTIEEFFGLDLATRLAKEGNEADLLICNNVLAHVPDINDFVAGLKVILKPEGVLTVEFPHLLRLMTLNQFDTIYHEHYSYLSFLTVERIFAKHGITLVDVEELPTHGGSLRIHGRHEGVETPSDNVMAMREKEKDAGLDKTVTYKGFAELVKQTKRDLLRFLIGVREDGKSIVGYGAPAKGNTLLNYCGIRNDFLDYTVDLSPHKQGLYLPGSRLPVHAPEVIFETKPDYLLILPWNLEEEIITQMAAIRDWGGKFVIPIPEVRIVE
jgi:SAM-dependent methyltransferase